MVDENVGDIDEFSEPGRFTFGEITKENFDQYRDQIVSILEEYLSEFLSTRDAAELLGYEDDDDFDSTVFGDLADALCESFENFSNYVRDEELEDVVIQR